MFVLTCIFFDLKLFYQFGFREVRIVTKLQTYFVARLDVIRFFDGQLIKRNYALFTYYSIMSTIQSTLRNKFILHAVHLHQSNTAGTPLPPHKRLTSLADYRPTESPLRTAKLINWFLVHNLTLRLPIWTLTLHRKRYRI
jgi:hypothetical protein